MKARNALLLFLSLVFTVEDRRAYAVPGAVEAADFSSSQSIKEKYGWAQEKMPEWKLDNLVLLYALGKFADDLQNNPSHPLLAFEGTDNRDTMTVFYWDDAMIAASRHAMIDGGCFSTGFDPELPSFSLDSRGKTYAQVLDEICKGDGTVTWRYFPQWNVIDVIQKDYATERFWPLNTLVVNGSGGPETLRDQLFTVIHRENANGASCWWKFISNESIGMPRSKMEPSRQRSEMLTWGMMKILVTDEAKTRTAALARAQSVAHTRTRFGELALDPETKDPGLRVPRSQIRLMFPNAQ